MPLSREEIDRVVATLEAIAEDRALLANVPDEQRLALLRAAGRVSRPTRDENRRAGKAFRVVRRKQSKEIASEHDRALRATTEIREARRADIFQPPRQLVGEAGANGELAEPRFCYVCKAEYRTVHFFYDAMCGACAALNYEKRFQTASLVGKVALITGARLKIGFHAALMMLRAGAHVVVTTRFPRDAAARYAKEPDFAEFRGRLEVHGLDLRHSPSVETFARHLERTLPRLDILINNAAQTVRRPPNFYAHLVDFETRPLRELSEDVRFVLRGHETMKRALGAEVRGLVSGIHSSAILSQAACVFDDHESDARFFPAGRVDADLQQVDLRTVNSWRMKLDEVPSPEMLEVQLVNAVAPFILCAKLKPLMVRHASSDKHIVNVSAMEGQFSRGTKTDRHPHTNMAKAALNMLTLTSARDYVSSGIHMNAVDTGWVTDEDPAAISARKQQEHDFQPPLDIVDGAARLCDPFFSGILTGTHVWGKFLKDYAPVAW